MGVFFYTPVFWYSLFLYTICEILCKNIAPRSYMACFCAFLDNKWFVDKSKNTTRGLTFFVLQGLRQFMTTY